MMQKSMSSNSSAVRELLAADLAAVLHPDGQRLINVLLGELCDGIARGVPVPPILLVISTAHQISATFELEGGEVEQEEIAVQARKLAARLAADLILTVAESRYPVNGELSPVVLLNLECAGGLWQAVWPINCDHPVRRCLRGPAPFASSDATGLLVGLLPPPGQTADEACIAALRSGSQHGETLATLEDEDDDEIYVEVRAQKDQSTSVNEGVAGWPPPDRDAPVEAGLRKGSFYLPPHLTLQ